MDTFDELVEKHRAVLRLHCYRMLGSSHDGDDMVQETFVRAFRSIESLHDPAAARSWLYRIATNVCLDELEKRPRRARGPEVGAASNPEEPPATPTADDVWLEPCPSSWLVPADPAAAYTMKESVALAFVAALQVLTPAQRAVLLLRDVVGLSAEETAVALESSVSAVNSALHRARSALEERVGPRASWSPESEAPVDRALLERYMRAWDDGDLDAIIALLHEEATLSMPPSPTWLQGRDAIARFLSVRVAPAARAKAFRSVAHEANGRPAIAFYRVNAEGEWRFFALQVIEVRDGAVAVMDQFRTSTALAAFFADGLPAILEARAD